MLGFVGVIFQCRSQFIPPVKKKGGGGREGGPCQRFGMQNWVRNLASISPKFDIKFTVWVVKKHSNHVSYDLKKQPYSLQIRLDPSPEFLSQ